MKKFSLAIAAAATVAALSAAPASAETTVTEQQYILKSILKGQKFKAPKVQTRATTFTTRAAPLDRYEAAKQRLFGAADQRDRSPGDR